jgi:hypothetical protein
MSMIAILGRRIPRAALIALAAVAVSGTAGAGSPEDLAARFAGWQPSAGADGPAVAITSREEGARMRGDIVGLLDASFDLLAARLASPRDWCDIALLHLNVKSCTHEKTTGGDKLTFYSGTKHYQAPLNAYALRYSFRVAEMRPDYLAVELTAPVGPLETRDYSIVVEAMPAGKRSFVHLSYGYRVSAASRFATTTYLATAGNGKKGFSIVSRDNDGRPKYVGGVRGIVERNAVRNFLAIEAYLPYCELPDDTRQARRFERWFELTERYPAQLRELQRDEYLSAKRQEYQDQLTLQQAIDSGSGTPR